MYMLYHLISGFLIGILTVAAPTFTNVSAAEDGECQPPAVLVADRCKPDMKPYLVKEFNISGPGVLKSSTFAGDIEVRTVEKSEKVRVELYIERGYDIWSSSKSLDNYRITVIQRGNEIIASTEQKTKPGFFGEKMRFSYKIYVPEKMSSLISSAGGDISVSGVRGDHLFKSSAGSIHLKDIKGQVRAYASGGDIEVRESQGTLYLRSSGGDIILDEPKGEIRVKTDGGNIICERVDGSMLADVGGGDIRAHFQHVMVGINFKTTAGDIVLELPSDTGYDLHLEASDFDLGDAKNFEGNFLGGTMEGTLSDGGLPVELVTLSGKITVKSN